MMLNFLKNFFKETEMFQIGKTDQGFFIGDRNGQIAEGTGFYSRRRDAVRGATRRGLSLA